MNSLFKSALIVAIAVGAAGCGHEARITGPTQCMAPRTGRLVEASALVRGHADLAAQASAESASF